ncbi:MAG: alpha-aminoadipate/glutamate carrier protein LysW [Nitrososphaeraceae archaeon]|jgi:alpha-aminoadipate carrier protein LysW
MKTECQDCGGEINVPDDAMVGEVITCPDCGADFEIESNEKEKGKVKLKPAETLGEDWGE